MSFTLYTLSPTRLLHPGKALMTRLSMRAKLALVGVCVLLPLTLLLVSWALNGQAAMRTLLLERDGLQVGGLLSVLGKELQKDRTLTVRVLAGDVAAKPLRDDVRKAVQQAAQRVGEAAASTPSLQIQPAWTNLANRLQRLQDAATPATAGEALTAYTEAVDQVADLRRLVAEQSRLLLDDSPEGFFTVELLATALPPVIEEVSRAAGLGSVVLMASAASPTERTELLVMARQLDQLMQQVKVSVGALERSGLVALQSWAATRTGVETFSTQLRESFGRETPELPAAALNAAAGEALAHLQNLQDEAHARVGESLDRRITAAGARLLASVAVFALVLGLTIYLFAVLYLSFMQSIDALQRSTQAVSSGDLSAQLKLDGRDELAAIGQTVNGMNERLSDLVGEIRNSAARVNMAGAQVAEGSQRLSVRTEEQASSLRESVVAISQLSSEVQNNAQAARELDGLTDELSRRATDGTQAMGETMVAVQKLQDASRRVFEVVAVIDDVAFQTGMLSLNAAVEAARAGEAGKGFSIVASEVRSLAQRVGESADEIRSLITLASDQLEISGSKLATANASLEGLSSGVQDVSTRLREISQASTQQSDTLVTVAQRVGDLDQITRDNSRLVDESTAAAHSLVERAQILRDAVASMRLRQGSADEARELLDRALQHVSSVGRDQGFKDLHDAAQGFIDRDLYVFALDRDGVYIACGAKPEMIGTSVNSLPGIQGTSFVQDAWAAAEAGGGWVQYQIANPLTGEVTPKESYMRQLDDGLLLGCGVYRRVAPGAYVTKPRAAAWSTKQEARAFETV